MNEPTLEGTIPQLREPAEIVWTTAVYDGMSCEEAHINGLMVACLTARPAYCDRGHWWVHCELPFLDHQDGYPRYYMKHDTAVQETELFLRWRLWQLREEWATPKHIVRGPGPRARKRSRAGRGYDEEDAPGNEEGS